MNNNILVFCEQRRGILADVTLELLGEARKISATTGGEVLAVIAGKDIAGHSNTLISHGADKVYVVQDDKLGYYITEPYASAVYDVVVSTQPSIVLIGATSIGRDLAPRLSARLHTGLTADCTTLEVGEDGTLLMTRPAFGGNLYATIVCPDHRPQMSTVRPGVMSAITADPTRQGQVVSVPLQYVDNGAVQLIEEVIESKSQDSIAKSPVLVSVGRGCGCELDMYQQLATSIGGMVSCSRAVVDSGVLPQSRQVGQTGTTVRPQVYVAIGMSGAVQHVAGMEGAEYVIAINKDANSAIFQVADLAIVGDAKEVVGLLNTTLAQRS